MKWLDDSAMEKMRAGHCPDCGHRGFVLGPRGGLSVNLECGGCGHRFNAAQTMATHHIIMAHRIPSRAEGGGDWSE